ncbi:MAG: hypothetical protein ABTQ26_00350, partial [Azonexus sp.]
MSQLPESIIKRLEEIRIAGAKHMGVDPDKAVIAHVTLTPEPCDHNWPEGDFGTDMEGSCT